MSHSVAAVAAVAVGCAALAAALLVRPSSRLPPLARRRAGAAWPALVAVPVLLVVVGGSWRTVALGGVLVAATVASSRLWRARAARLETAATSARVLETCESLAAELGAGRPPGTALARAVDDWPDLAPVAEAHRVGADVPSAWRAMATRPGAGDLRYVAAAWQVSHRTGEGLADTLDRVARSLRAAAATRRVVDGELASARATAKLVAALPLLALTMGNGAGGDPWAFLLGHPVGLACLALGLALALAGLAWIEALAREVDRP